jgi:uncharacterized protein with beta-barrel porin domain
MSARVVGQWLYGAALGFGEARVTQDVTGDHGRNDTFRAGAYASYRPGPWWVTGAMAVGLSSIDATRLSAADTGDIVLRRYHLFNRGAVHQ